MMMQFLVWTALLFAVSTQAWGDEDGDGEEDGMSGLASLLGGGGAGGAGGLMNMLGNGGASKLMKMLGNGGANKLMELAPMFAGAGGGDEGDGPNPMAMLSALSAGGDDEESGGGAMVRNSPF
ncbi:signal recognition particle 54 kDa protein-like isoform X1 [Lacerta agilis]|uniref:signal recognition particle 54 kDa protein-like isoform X1 n=1 Tax=Lacerta agilis TaxID=80427 RepID=UPI0014191D2A|nr:signal recognition particle 54 kDa protein-like isoform X1 [Lacerta agilis]